MPEPTTGLRRVLPYVRPYYGQMAAMVVSATAAIGFATAVPIVTKRVIDGPLAHHQPGALARLAGLALLFGLAEGVCLWIRRWVQANAATAMETAIRDDFYAHLQALPVGFHDGWQSGQLVTRLTSDLSTIRRFIAYGAIFLVVNTVTFGGVMFLLVRLNVALAVVTAAAALPILVLSRRFGHDYHAAARRLQDQQGDLTTLVEESATGIRVTKAFGRSGLLQEHFAGAARTVYDSSMRTVYLRSRFFSLLGTIPNLIVAAVLLGGALAVGHGLLTLGGLVAFISLLLMLVWPVESLGEILAMVQEAAAATNRIFEVFDAEPDICDRPGARAVSDVDGRVRFEGVGFAYPGHDTPVLRDVNLEVAPGETLALVGRTGSGKTTIANLLPRLYDPSAGRITIDGVDVRDMKLSSLRRHVAVAFEDPILFSASVRENLLLGCPDASEADVVEAIDVAQASFVHDLPWGLDTRVGEQGLSLSGGQRQRLALARAVLGRPRILVLDDPLSALDVHTEALVEEALRRILTGTTALLVAHRPSTLALADRVAWIDGGTVAALGTHAELMATVPAYRATLSQEAEDLDGPAGERATAVNAGEVAALSDSWHHFKRDVEEVDR